ncbi:AMP-binding protein [bacterium]|nr:AMP-binding protein [bacterium]
MRLRGGGDAIEPTSLLEICCHDHYAAIVPWTRDELRAQMLAFDLRSWGVSAGARIAFLFPNGVLNAVALLAAMNRYCVMTLNPTEPAEAHASKLQCGGVCCLVTVGTKLAEVATAVASVMRVTLVRLQDASGPEGSFTVPVGGAEVPACAHAPMGWEDAVLILHTSGTTGVGKRVPFTLRRLIAAGTSLADSLKLGTQVCGLNMMPLHHVGGIACNLVAPLVGRSRMLYAPSFDAVKWCSMVRWSQPTATWCYAVPTMWSLILQHCDSTGDVLPPTLRLLRSGAAHMPHNVALRLARLLGPHGCFLPTYSMTECMPIASPSIGYTLDRPASVGTPLCIDLRIMDGADNAMPDGEVGEVSLLHRQGSDDQLFDGYEAAGPNEPVVKAGVRMSCPFKTGDLGRLDNGWLFLTGRAKECINRGGELLSPAHIDSVLCEHPLINEAMTFSSPHDEFGETVAVLLPLDSAAAALELRELRKWSHGRLAAAQVPQVLVRAPQLPRTHGTRKLLRVGYAKLVGLPSVSGGTLHTYVFDPAHKMGPKRLVMVEPSAPTCVTGSPHGVHAAADDVEMLDCISGYVSELTGKCIVDVDVPLMDLGMDSLTAMQLVDRLQGLTAGSISVTGTLLFNHPSVRELAGALTGSEGQCIKGAVCASQCAGRRGAVLLTGVSSRSAGHVEGVIQVWRVSACGLDTVMEVPASRWEPHAIPSPDSVSAARARHGGFLFGVELFAHGFFGVSPAEALAMDPQQRLVLESGYASLQASGECRRSLMHSATGVFVAVYANDFAHVLTALPLGTTVYAATGSAHSIASGRLSFALGLQGPCTTYNSACSSALVASHGALRALQLLECANSLVAAANVMLIPSRAPILALAGMTSARGRCHTFDARADGYARAECCCAASICAPSIYITTAQSAAVLGSAIRQDGKSASLTAPNGDAQHRLLKAALGDSATDAAALTGSEAHGTGTALGDPIEVGSFTDALSTQRNNCSPLLMPLLLGGIKATVGHGEAAAGLIGLLKLVTALRERTGVPNAQLRIVNRHALPMLRSAACSLLTQSVSLIMGTGDNAVGGLSSFGYAGTIAHTVITAEVASSVCQPTALELRRHVFNWHLSDRSSPLVVTAGCPSVLYVTNEGSVLRRVLPSNKVSLQLQVLSALASNGRITLRVHHLPDVAVVDGDAAKLIDLAGFTTVFVGVMPTAHSEVNSTFCKVLHERSAKVGAALLNACTPRPNDVAATILQADWSRLEFPVVVRPNANALHNDAFTFFESQSNFDAWRSQDPAERVPAYYSVSKWLQHYNSNSSGPYYIERWI